MRTVRSWKGNDVNQDEFVASIIKLCPSARMLMFANRIHCMVQVDCSDGRIFELFGKPGQLSLCMEQIEKDIRGYYEQPNSD